ncbi:MAG: zf-HC2 domain-containing protein [Thermoanaerobaculia bacterium]
MSETSRSSREPYITCREVIEFIIDYLDGELPSEDLRQFKRHLDVCPSCVAYLQNYEQTLRLARDSHEELDLPEGLVAAVLAARSV